MDPWFALGVVLAVVGMLVGKVYGQRAERNFDRVLWGGLLGVIVFMLAFGMIWCAITGDC